MLTFNEKLAIIESFPELERKDVSLGRINFQLPSSILEKKNVVYHLHPNGNGFVYAGHLDTYQTNEKGLVNIRDFTAEQLQKILRDSIQGLTENEKTEFAEAILGDSTDEQRWVDKDNNQLILINENDAWNIYFGLNLDNSFDTYEEAVEYLSEEGFKQVE